MYQKRLMWLIEGKNMSEVIELRRIVQKHPECAERALNEYLNGNLYDAAYNKIPYERCKGQIIACLK